VKPLTGRDLTVIRSMQYADPAQLHRVRFATKRKKCKENGLREAHSALFAAG
jgi:hypothetical protein